MENDPKTQGYLKARVTQLNTETATRNNRQVSSKEPTFELSPALLILLLVLAVSVAALGYLLAVPHP